jgi:hypothetical protein
LIYLLDGHAQVECGQTHFFDENGGGPNLRLRKDPRNLGDNQRLRFKSGRAVDRSQKETAGEGWSFV